MQIFLRKNYHYVHIHFLQYAMHKWAFYHSRGCLDAVYFYKHLDVFFVSCSQWTKHFIKVIA